MRCDRYEKSYPVDLNFQKFSVLKFEFQADLNLNFRWPYLLNGAPIFVVSNCVGHLPTSTLSLESVKQVFLLFFGRLLLFVHNCIEYVLIGVLFARIDCPGCTASFCEDCDCQEQEEGK